MINLIISSFVLKNIKICGIIDLRYFVDLYKLWYN